MYVCGSDNSESHKENWKIYNFADWESKSKNLIKRIERNVGISQ